MEVEVSRLPLLKKSNIKKFALAIAAEERAAVGFSRVGASFYEHVETSLKEMIRRYVHSLPSKGVTLR